MIDLFETSHKLWTEAQIRAPAWAQATIIPYLHELKEIARLRPYLVIDRLYGQNRGGSLTVDYVGLNYEPTLIDTLFTEEPTAKEFGRVAAWKAGTLATQSDSDLVIVVSGKQFVRRLPRENAILQPFYVSMLLDVRGDWQDTIARIHKGVHRNEFRLVRKYGYEYKLSHRKEDFELFYFKMYEPTMKKRHGDSAWPMSIREAYQYFRNGCVQLVKRDGRYVAGGVSYVQGGVVKAKLIGVIDADDQLIHEGALGAYYYALVHLANQKGYDSVFFGGCLPRLTDGVFRYKRKWGAAVTYSETVHKQIWIRIQRDTPAVRQFFKDNPMIVIGECGQLQGLIVVDDPSNIAEATLDEWNKQYATPGLDGLLVYSMTDLFNESVSVRKTG